jgi:hypothetical protein
VATIANDPAEAPGESDEAGLPGHSGHSVTPLDPQDMALGVSPGKRGLIGDALGVVTCGLFGRVQSVWSQSGPKLRFEEPVEIPSAWTSASLRITKAEAVDHCKRAEVINSELSRCLRLHAACLLE